MIGSLMLAAPLQAASPAKRSVTKRRVKPVPARTVRTELDGGSVLERIPRIDPAVTALKVRMLKRLSPYEARIAIIGYVKNIGNKDFKSSPNQQSATLVKKIPGVRAPQLLKQRKFTVLPAGKGFTVSYVMNWQTSQEFPPSFELYLNYDPDIRLDGNPQNDDAVSTNNSKQIVGGKLNAIVRRMLSKR
jgi:hypothetical protein